MNKAAFSLIHMGQQGEVKQKLPQQRGVWFGHLHLPVG